jgi:putative hydroxymethylpyrimidine transport system substrate-binding protein
MSGSQDPKRPTTLDRPTLRRRRTFPTAARLSALAACAALLAGCGGSDDGTTSPAATTTTAATPTTLDLTLDFAPNAVHSGLYVAQQDGSLAAAAVDLKIRVPGSGADGAKLLAAGRTDLAIMDIHDVALAREQGAELVAVGAIVQRPLAAVLASRGIARPRDLEGERVGVTGLPSDDAALDQIVRGDGGDPQKVRRVEIGFEAVASVLGGRVAAAIGFWNAEGVALQARRPSSSVFRLDAFGAPVYPELLLMSTPKVLGEHGDAIERLTGVLATAYGAVSTGSDDQDAATIAALTAGSGDKTIDPDTTAAQLRAVRPALTNADGRALAIDREQMRKWASWEAASGITRDPPDVDALIWSRAPGR